MCREGWTGKQEEREGQNTDRHYPPATLGGVGEMKEWTQRDKRWEKDILQMHFAFDRQFLTPTSLCSACRAETLQMIANFEGTGGVSDSCLWGLLPGWWTCNSSVWECHSAVRVCSFVCCAYYDGTPEEAALSETSLKINICSPSCEEFRFRSQDKKSKPTIKTDVKSTETNLIFFRVVVYFFSIPGFVWGSEGLIFRQNWKKH